jgi:hypothetical protein
MGFAEIRSASLMLTTVAALLGIQATVAKAVDCPGATIVAFIEYGSTKCSGQAAFKIAGIDRWICTLNVGQGRLALAAFLSGKPVAYEFTDLGACTSHGSATSFTKSVRYLSITQ